MTITTLESGESLHLPDDAQLQMERPNPFFSEWAEQSVALDLPASERNLRLTGHPDAFANRQKQPVMQVAISDGDYYAQCRSVVLSVRRGESVQAAFYPGDGSFYSKIQDIPLRSVFTLEEDTITFPGQTREEQVAAAIAQCRQLRVGLGPLASRMMIPTLLVTDDSGTDSGHFNYKIVNRYGKPRQYNRTVSYPDATTSQVVTVNTSTATVYSPSELDGGCDFYNAAERQEHVGGKLVNISPGYYIAPQLRALYVLRRVVEHFGYTLDEGFFDRTAPFPDMLLLHNVIDLMANGWLKLQDMVPDVSVADFLSMWRKKFGCELRVDEMAKVVDFVFFSDMATASQPVADLTPLLRREPQVDYHSEKDYRRVVLSAKKQLDSDVEQPETLSDLLAKHPQAQFNALTGVFEKEGWRGSNRVVTRVAESSMPFNTGDATGEEEIEVPEMQAEFRNLEYIGPASERYPVGQFLYVGDYTTLHSTLKFSDPDSNAESRQSEKTEARLPMLAFGYLGAGGHEATVTEYSFSTGQLIGLYSLTFYGERGIFERFYRQRDLLQRNALQEVKAELLFTGQQKRDLTAFGLYTLRGLPVMFKTMKFTLGNRPGPVECDLLTAAPAQPVGETPVPSELLPAAAPGYQWVLHRTMRQLDPRGAEWAQYYKEGASYATIYPPVPTEQLAGTEFGRQSIAYRVWISPTQNRPFLETTWLTCDAVANG